MQHARQGHRRQRTRATESARCPRGPQCPHADNTPSPRRRLPRTISEAKRQRHPPPHLGDQHRASNCPYQPCTQRPQSLMRHAMEKPAMPTWPAVPTCEDTSPGLPSPPTRHRRTKPHDVVHHRCTRHKDPLCRSVPTCCVSLSSSVGRVPAHITSTRGACARTRQCEPQRAKPSKRNPSAHR